MREWVGGIATHLVPGCVVFFGSGLCRRLQHLVSFIVRRVQINHGQVIVQCVEDYFSRYPGRQRSDCSEDRAFRHVEG